MTLIELDFKKDYMEFIQNQIPLSIKNKISFTPLNRKSILRLEMALYKYRKSKYDGRKRGIIYSTKYKEKLKTLTKENNEIINFIEQCIRSGNKELNKKESKILNKASYEFLNLKENIEKQTYLDRLLLLLGINHYRLSKAKKNDKLLYLRYEKNHVYFLDIGSHRKMYDYEHFIEIFEEENWDNLLPLKLEGITGTSDSEHKKENFKTRKSNVMTTILGKKGVYVPQNIVASDGTPMSLVRYNDFRCLMIEDFEDFIKKSLGYVNRNTVEFKALWEYTNLEKVFVFKEKNSKMIFLLLLENTKDKMLKNMRIVESQEYLIELVKKNYGINKFL